MDMPTADIVEELNRIEAVRGLDSDAAWARAIDHGWNDRAATEAHLSEEAVEFVTPGGEVIAWNDQTGRWVHDGSLQSVLDGRP